MKRLLLALLFLATFSPFAQAADKLKDVTLAVGETVYARFEVSGKKLKLVATGKEADAGAQVIFTLTHDAAKNTVNLRVENKLPKDLLYRGEIRSKKLNLHSPANVTPVVAGKLSFETFPGAVEEFSAFDFKFPR